MRRPRPGELARGRQKLGPVPTVQKEQAGSGLVPRIEGSGHPSRISDLCSLLHGSLILSLGGKAGRVGPRHMQPSPVTWLHVHLPVPVSILHSVQPGSGVQCLPRSSPWASIGKFKSWAFFSQGGEGTCISLSCPNSRPQPGRGA